MEETKKCPYCGEEIKLEAIKCKHCQSMLEQPQIDNNKEVGKLESDNNSEATMDYDGKNNARRIKFKLKKSILRL